MENGKCCTVDFVEDEYDASHDEHNHSHAEGWKAYAPGVFSFVFLALGLSFKYFFKFAFFQSYFEIGWYLFAYIPVAFPVIREAFETLKKGEVFTEFFLMTIATLGAFGIGEYPEGVAVMLFYAVGELFQNAAVQRSKESIRALMEIRPEIASVKRNDVYEIVDPKSIVIGEIIRVKVGEKVPLDGKLLSEKGTLNTAALTGESRPFIATSQEDILAGSINLENVIEIEVTRLFEDSSVAKIIDLVQNATARKAKTELLIRRLAKIYTPVVVYLALAICILPYFFVEEYMFRDWLYRALIFLVIACPCALVISIPLGYFGGLGAASKNGLLFKGANYLDLLTRTTTLVMDKTGTLTEGVFEVQSVVLLQDVKEETFLKYLGSLESQSTHPIAKAILRYLDGIVFFFADEVKEIPGQGIVGKVNGDTISVGNRKLMESVNISYPAEVLDSIVETVVLLGRNSELVGYVTISDRIKNDAQAFVDGMKKKGIGEFVVLSGDKDSITKDVATRLGIAVAKGGLLPEEKLFEVERLQEQGKLVAFMGDGINDAPVIAAADIGIAMGAMGSDVAIETADIILQTDAPAKLVIGFEIARSTQSVIWQNIYLALGVKIAVLVLGAFGMATMWEAVFADVGVALLAILNAVRLQRMTWTI